MKLVAFIQMCNESSRGNLRRCLGNCKQWADDIVIYDDASTDDSVAVAREYTDHIIVGKENCFRRELYHKQELLEYALTLSPDWIFWIDCDEIVDRQGTTGALRSLAESADASVMSFGFKEINLWRSLTYARRDGYFSSAWFIRLWRVVPGMRINASEGLDRPSYPAHCAAYAESSIKVIHYKFADYKRLIWGSGFGNLSTPEFQAMARTNYIFNESASDCYRVPNEWFPVENIPPDLWTKPEQIPIDHLKCHRELD